MLSTTYCVRLLLLLLAADCTLAATETVHRYEIGVLPNLFHGIQGTLYAQGSAGTTIVITNFHYDGGGPDAYLYVYRRGATVRTNGGGVIIPLSATQTRFTLGRRYSGETLIAHITDGSTITDYGTFTIWCRAASVFFTRISIPSNLFTQDPIAVEVPIVPPTAYDNCESLSDELQVSWTVDQTASRIFFQLCGCVDVGDYMAFGLSGSNSTVQMVGADAVVTWHNSEGTRAVDYYLSARAQCRSGVGACPDDVQSGANNTVVLGGRTQGTGRCVEYVRPLTASESRDRAITPDSAQYIVWATGPRGTVDGFAYYHARRTPNLQTTLQFGRTPADNCGTPPSCMVVQVCPYAQTYLDERDRDATFVAEIGQSGGNRGYQALTGVAGWGIAWFINETFIPVIRVTRGYTYTFLVYGGQVSTVTARYHPFYISNSSTGGRLANSPQERELETVYAGIAVGDTATAVGPLCMYMEGPSSASARENCSTTFDDYFATLQQVCEAGQPGVLKWTPDMNTPDTVYYQCATHVNLGWKFEVNDPAPQPSSTTADSTSSPLPKETSSPLPRESTSSPLPRESTSSPLPRETSSPLPRESTSSLQPRETSSSPLPRESTSSPQPRETSSPLPRESMSSPQPRETSSPLPRESTSSPQPRETSSPLPRESTSSPQPRVTSPPQPIGTPSRQPTERTSSHQPSETPSPQPGESPAPPLRTSEAPSPTTEAQPADSHAMSYYSSRGAVSVLLTALGYLFVVLM